MLWVATSACHASTVIPPGEVELGVSGSRLRVMRWTGSGAALRDGFWDSELAVECRFRYTSDGFLRCLPVGRIIGSAFASASCEEPVIQDFDGCGARFGLAPVDGGGCGPHMFHNTAYAVYEATDRLGTRPFRRLGGECLEADIPSEGDYVAARMSDARFVSARLEERASEGRFGSMVLIAEDGAMRRWSMLDSRLGSACWLDGPVDGPAVCLPSRAFVSFEDAECSEPVARRFEEVGSCGPPVAAVDFGFGRDCLPPRLYALGAVRTVRELYGSQFELECGVTADETVSVWSLDEEVGVAFVPRPEGEGRLRRLLFRNPTGAGGEIERRVLWDDERGEPCTPTRVASGDARCIPIHAPLRQGWFSDPLCVAPLLVVSHEDCTRTPSYAVRRSGDAACGGVRPVESLYAVGAVTTEAYRRVDEACEPVALASQETAYRVDTQVPFESFAVLERAVD